LVGHLQGGLGHVNIIASVIFAGMSGSSIADAAGLGSVEVKAMIEEGYDPEFAAAVTAASSTIGPIIPPSILMVIYGILAEASIGELFLGGVLPGFVMALSMMVLVYFISKNKGYPIHKRASISQTWTNFRKAFLSLLFPIIILGGIAGGIFTPTEAAMVAVAYAISLGFFYREFTLKGLIEVFHGVIKTNGSIMFVFGAASLFSWVVTMEQIPVMVRDLMMSFTQNKYVFLVLVNIFFLILGCFLDVIAVLIIAVPVLSPLIPVYGVDPIHFGVVMVFNLMFGGLTPPVGMLLFIMTKLTGISFHRAIFAVLPFMIPLGLTLIAITYFDQIVLFLPKLIMR
jgi:tripartite ATP-independent transporter DctM subunit